MLANEADIMVVAQASSTIEILDSIYYDQPDLFIIRDEYDKNKVAKNA